MIPDNYLLAEIRTEHLLTRLNKNFLLKPSLKEYDDITKDYLKEGMRRQITFWKKGVYIIYHTGRLFVMT